MQPAVLERYAFLWSEARLLIAAVALLAGGVPTITLILPVTALGGLVGILLKLAWIISGAVSAYLAYRWFTGGKTVFGGSDSKDMGAFFVNVLSGFNLGIAGLIGKNIGMSISSSYLIFIIVALLYLAAAYQLYVRWNAFGKKIF